MRAGFYLTATDSNPYLGRVDELIVDPIVAQDSILEPFKGQLRKLGYHCVSPNSSTEPSEQHPNQRVSPSQEYLLRQKGTFEPI